MDPENAATITKIVPPNLYSIKNSTGQVLKLQLVPLPIKPSFIHLLKDLSGQRSVVYQQMKKTPVFQDEYQKASISLNGKNLSELYSQEIEIKECTDETIYQKNEIHECYIMKVECLKLKLYLLEHKKYIIFYFSQFRLPKIQNSHPKQVWQKAQDFFNNEFLGQFVQIRINGSQTYHDELNINGEILRLHDGEDLKDKMTNQGWVQLSKNAGDYLQKQKLEKYEKNIQNNKKNKKGMWRDEKRNPKATNQIIEQKYRIWEEWTKEKKKYNEIHNVETQLSQICSELKKNSGAKTDPTKSRILLQVFLTIMDDCVTEKNMKFLEDFIKILIGAMVNLQVNLVIHVQSMDFLKYLNKILILLIFYVTEAQSKKSENKKMVAELQKVMKIVFKCCFIGNEIFHEKVFDKNKESDFQKFSFDPAYLSGISSYSEYSDYQEADNMQKEKKHHKKISSAQTKIRMNATILLAHMFRLYQPIVEKYWQMCVKPNVLTQEFFNYLSNLRIHIESTKMPMEEKRKIANLMRTNFGDYSLVLLIFFEQNAKIKLNALNCMINMIDNFQGKKMIDTTEAVYIEKLLKQTKSSFVPKSFIIFSGLRNALYFMLFSLHHEKNIAIIVQTFKALTHLCEQSTLIDKMSFMEGMGLLMSNYINPVLMFPWEIPELAELKTLCIGFLGALVGTQKKWDEIETQYLLAPDAKNINRCLLQVMDQKRLNQKEPQTDKIVQEITKYFTKMTKKYYSALFSPIEKYGSVWNYVSDFFLQNNSTFFTNFVEEVFKCYVDKLNQRKDDQRRKQEQYLEIAETQLHKLVRKFFPVYGQIVTSDNYTSLINILTYIDYGQWSLAQYEKARDFLCHCFESLQGKSSIKDYPSIENLKTNSQVRISLIKLLGYMSFCPEFHIPAYAQQAIRNLLNYSRQYKSFNSVVKITWGISNWCNIPHLKESIKKQELKQCLDYMILHSRSEKEKIASNCTRGIGFFMNNFRASFSVEACRSAIIKNLTHPILKVRTNSTKTLQSMTTNKLLGKDEAQVKELIHELVPILEQNILKNNYHLQMETLLLIKELDYPIKPSHMLVIYSRILRDIHSHTTMEYEFSEIRTLKQLRKIILSEVFRMPECIRDNEQVGKEIYSSVESYLLDSQEESNREQAQNSQIFERGFEKGEEALNAVFNIHHQHYNEQKMITTKLTTRGIRYKAQEKELELLKQIQSISQKLSNLDEEWKYLSTLSIDGSQISLKAI